MAESPRRVLITGLYGQDGYYLSQYLTRIGDEVYGIVRPGPRPSANPCPHIDPARVFRADICDASTLERVIKTVEPEEVYNLAAQSHVGDSFCSPAGTLAATGVGAVTLFEAVRAVDPHIAVFQASSSELFGNTPTDRPYNEDTAFSPQSPYAVAKLLAHTYAHYLRQVYDMDICCGIMFNHESPRRPARFVTQKLVYGMRDIAEGKLDKLRMGTPHAARDWGFAGDYMRAAVAMLRNTKHARFTYVISSGETHTVREFAAEAAAAYGIADWESHIEWDCPEFGRPGEVWRLHGDSSAIRRELGWEPEVDFGTLVRMMCREASVQSS